MTDVDVPTLRLFLWGVPARPGPLPRSPWTLYAGQEAGWAGVESVTWQVPYAGGERAKETYPVPAGTPVPFNKH